jgi:hypothetical protein
MLPRLVDDEHHEVAVHAGERVRLLLRIRARRDGARDHEPGVAVVALVDEVEVNSNAACSMRLLSRHLPSSAHRPVCRLSPVMLHATIFAYG